MDSRRKLDGLFSVRFSYEINLIFFCFVFFHQKLEKKFRNKFFKIGEDDEGYSVKLKMKYYRQYIERNIDDSPMYLFESSFGEVIIPNCWLNLKLNAKSLYFLY